MSILIKCPTCGETEDVTYWGYDEYNCNECNTQFDTSEDAIEQDICVVPIEVRVKELVDKENFRQATYDYLQEFDVGNIEEFNNRTLASGVLSIEDKDYIIPYLLSTASTPDLDSFIRTINQRIQTMENID